MGTGKWVEVKFYFRETKEFNRWGHKKILVSKPMGCLCKITVIERQAYTIEIADNQIDQ